MTELLPNPSWWPGWEALGFIPKVSLDPIDVLDLNFLYLLFPLEAGAVSQIISIMRLGGGVGGDIGQPAQDSSLADDLGTKG